MPHYFVGKNGVQRRLTTVLISDELHRWALENKISLSRTLQEALEKRMIDGLKAEAGPP